MLRNVAVLFGFWLALQPAAAQDWNKIMAEAAWDWRPVVSRMWWKLPNSGLRACNVGSSQAARSRDIGTRG